MYLNHNALSNEEVDDFGDATEASVGFLSTKNKMRKIFGEFNLNENG